MHKDVCHWNSTCNNEKQKQKANPDTHQQKFHKQWHNHTRSATQPSKKNGNQPTYKYYSLSTWVIHSVSRSVIFNYQQYTLKIQGKKHLKNNVNIYYIQFSLYRCSFLLPTHDSDDIMTKGNDTRKNERLQ